MGEGPGVPDTSEWKKKRLVESGAFREGRNKTGRHLDDFEVQFEARLWVNL